MRIKIIANPAAGKGRVGKKLAALKPFLMRLPAEFDFAVTTQSGHACELAKEAVATGQFEVIAAMGGDGTVNEVVNGLMSEREATKRPALGILPGGRGRDFCKADGIGLPNDLQEAARVLVGRQEHLVDVGRVTFEDGQYPTRYFINIASVGFDAVVTEEANRYPNRFASYYRAILRALQIYQNKTVVYKLDGYSATGKFNSLVIANGNYYGNGMRIAPSARVQDGQFEIVLLGDISGPGIALEAALLYTGLHKYHPKIKILSGRKLEIEVANGESPMLLQMDGEVVGQTPATFEIIAGAVRIKVA